MLNLPYFFNFLLINPCSRSMCLLVKPNSSNSWTDLKSAQATMSSMETRGRVPVCIYLFRKESLGVVKCWKFCLHLQKSPTDVSILQLFHKKNYESIQNFQNSRDFHNPTTKFVNLYKKLLNFIRKKEPKGSPEYLSVDGAEWTFHKNCFRIPKFHISAFKNHLQTKSNLRISVFQS